MPRDHYSDEEILNYLESVGFNISTYAAQRMRDLIKNQRPTNHAYNRWENSRPVYDHYNDTYR